MHPRMIAATISVTQLAVPVLRPCVCYVCVMGVGVRPAPRRRLGFERRGGLATGLGSPLGLATGLATSAYYSPPLPSAVTGGA